MPRKLSVLRRHHFKVLTDKNDHDSANDVWRTIMEIKRSNSGLPKERSFA